MKRKGSTFILRVVQKVKDISEKYALLYDSRFAMLVSVGYSLWMYVGGVLLWASGAMARVPKELLEAASLDGISWWGEIIYIIIPMIGEYIQTSENCYYGKFELLSLALARAGKLGTLVHAHGAYGHDLRDEVLGGNVNRHYRLKNYLSRNCENYPTHELGPIAKILDVNRGNRMMSLVSVASKAAGLEEFSYTDKNPDKSLAGKKFKQGDIVNTIITCANGETISLKLDTTLPRYYSREFTLRGTKGLCNQEADMIFLEEDVNVHEFFDPDQTLRKYMGNAQSYDAYIPACWKEITEEEKEAGHGGMDYFMLRDFFGKIGEKKPFPIDVYDAASWMSISTLSEESVAKGGAPVAIPDFTRGKWMLRAREDVRI